MSKEDIKEALRGLGLKRGDVVGVHSSLKSFGYVEGGADAVIDALLETVGEEGTVVMPAHSNNLAKVELTPEETAIGVSWLFKILPYNPKETPCRTGVISEAFRKRNGVLRSAHPSNSIAAKGPKAKGIVETRNGTSLDGWQKVLEFDGHVLLMGVGLGVCTAMHLAESRVKFPEHILKKITPPKWFVEKYPDKEWEWDIGPYPNFAKLEEPCIQREIVKIAKAGRATLKLIRLKELVGLYVEYLQRNPDLFYA